jgi:hypothetical protein
MFLSNWNSQSSQSVTQLQTDLMRKQTSLRTTQSASARERFLPFALRIVPAMAMARLIGATERLVGSDDVWRELLTRATHARRQTNTQALIKCEGVR